MRKSLWLLKSAVSSCPYTLLGKKVVEAATGKGKPSHAAAGKQKWNGTVRTGRNIALIGVFCPFFWLSLLSGASAQMIRFNAVHSGAVVLIGLATMACGYWMCRRTRGLSAIQPGDSVSNVEPTKGTCNEVQ